MQYWLFAVATLGVVFGGGVGCGGEPGSAGDDAVGGGPNQEIVDTRDVEPGLIVGIESDLDLLDRVSWLRVTVSRDGDEEVLELGQSGGPELRFPVEVPVAPQRNGAPIDVMLEAFDSDGDTLSVRQASTVARAERKLLLRLRLEDECALGAADTPACQSDQTCVARHCTDPYIKPEHLPDYDEAWAEPYSDACCPIDAGPAVALLGDGDGAFSALDPGGELYLEAGPQGGHHVWLGLHIENLHEDATMTLRAYAPDLPYEFLAIPARKEYEPVGQGCTVWGVRYELRFDSPYAGSSASVLVGETVHFEVTVIDEIGNAAIAELDAVITDQPK